MSEEKKSQSEEKSKVEEASSTQREASKKSTEEGRALRARYLALKKYVLERDQKKDSFSKIVIIRENKKYWKFVGVSALIFTYEVAHELGMRPQIREDTDYDLKASTGVVNIGDIDRLLDKMKNAGYEIVPGKKDSDSAITFNLGKKFTWADIRAIERKRAEEWAKINNTILPKQCWPLLYKVERELLSTIFFMAQHLDPQYRELITNGMVERAIWLVREYNICANNYDDEKAINYLEEAARNIAWINGQMEVLLEVRVLTAEKSLRLAQAIYKVKDEVKRCLSKMKK